MRGKEDRQIRISRMSSPESHLSSQTHILSNTAPICSALSRDSLEFQHLSHLQSRPQPADRVTMLKNHCGLPLTCLDLKIHLYLKCGNAGFGVGQWRPCPFYPLSCSVQKPAKGECNEETSVSFADKITISCMSLERVCLLKQRNRRASLVQVLRSQTDVP